MNPWEKYQSSDTVNPDVTTNDGPWAKYQSGGDTTPQPKPFYDALGANLTPQQEADHPILGTAEKMLQNVATGGEKIVNGLSFGLVDNQLKKNNIEPPKLNVGDPANQGGANLIEDAGSLAGNISNPFVNAAVDKVAVGAGNLISKIPAVKNRIATMAMSPEFKQTMADVKYNHDPRRVLQSMPDTVGSDIPSSQEAIKNKLSETGQALEDTISNHPNSGVETDIEKQITKPIDDKISELYSHPNDNKASINKLKGLKEDLLNHYDPATDTSTPIDFSKMTPKQILDYRKAKIDPQVSYTGLTKDQSDANQVLQDIRGNLRNTMNGVIPDLKPLNQDYGDLISAKESLDRLAYKAQGQGLPSLKLADIASLGINKYLSNPINRVKFAQWLYTAPKAQVAQAAQQIPGFQAAVQNSYGGFKNAQLVTPTGLPKPSNYKIGINRALPSPQAAGTADASVIQQPGYVPPGLPTPAKAMLRPGRALPSPAVAGQSSGPVINQAGFTPAGSLPSPESVSAAPEIAPSKAMPIKDEYGSNTPISLPGKVEAGVTRPASTPAGKYLQDQMMAKERLPLHPMEDLKAEHGELYSPQAKQNIARNLGIDPEEVDKLAKISDYFDHIEPGTNQGRSGNLKDGFTNWGKKSDYPDYIQSIGPKRAKGIIKNALDGKPVSEFQKKVFKKLLKDYGSI